MKRKKWTEGEEETLITAYSDLLTSSGVISQLRTREKKFQPIADRVNSIHHFRDPAAFPFCWTWRDVSVKIQNMRHQYLGVKLKISSSSPDWDHALNLWPNFLRYKSVFGDVDRSPSPSDSSRVSVDNDDGEVRSVGKMVADLGEVLVRREGNRRERESVVDARLRKRQREMYAFATGSKDEEERRERWRRREEIREAEEMEWWERALEIQMEHKKQVMQLHAGACQAQLQMLGILVRLSCQFLSPGGAGSDAGGGDGGIDGLEEHDLHNLQQQQQSSESLVCDNGKNDVHSGEEYFSITVFIMGMDDSKDVLNSVDWKTVGSADATKNTDGLITRKRLPKKIRHVPEFYFIPKWSLTSTLAIYGACCVAGVGAGMLLEVWIKKRIKDDTDVIWKM